jgi:tight adherence protein B
MTTSFGAALAALVAATVLAVTAAHAAWGAAPARARAHGLRPARRPEPEPARAAGGLISGLDRRLVDAGLAHAPTTVLAVWAAAAGLVVTGALVVGGAALAVMALVGALAVPAVLLRLRRGRADEAVELGLPDALEVVAAGLRAGSTLPLAIAAAATGAPPRLHADLLGVVHDADVVGLAAAADAWVAKRPRPGVRLAAAAIALSSEVGGAGARAIDGVALTIRQRREAVAEVRALATQARLSAVILTVAPLVFAGFAGAADPRSLRFLLADPAGHVCLFAGLVLDVVGAAWMGRVTRAGSA